ncbi:C-type natriuretic peptide [Manis javanica]|nr:C-type natriuretic peptide [Manis javanica]
MHLSQLLACVLLLTLLSLRASEAKPGAPPKVQRTPPGEELAEPQAAGGGQKKGDKTTPGGGGANRKGDGKQQEGLVQGLLRPQAGPDWLHERPGMLVRRPLAADWELAPFC